VDGIYEEAAMVLMIYVAPPAGWGFLVLENNMNNDLKRPIQVS
jgi:hypothetical protein